MLKPINLTKHIKHTESGINPVNPSKVEPKVEKVQESHTYIKDYLEKNDVNIVTQQIEPTTLPKVEISSAGVDTRIISRYGKYLFVIIIALAAIFLIPWSSILKDNPLSKISISIPNTANNDSSQIPASGSGIECVFKQGNISEKSSVKVQEKMIAADQSNFITVSNNSNVSKTVSIKFIRLAGNNSYSVAYINRNDVKIDSQAYIDIILPKNLPKVKYVLAVFDNLSEESKNTLTFKDVDALLKESIYTKYMEVY